MMFDILVCHAPGREVHLRRLQEILAPQLIPGVRVLVDDDPRKSIGKKRNDVMARADAKYMAFVDDDDRVSPNYVDLLMQGMRTDVDWWSLVGEITCDGANPRVFLHSIKDTAYSEANGIYYRYPNHLNCIKVDMARRFEFPKVNCGEDGRVASKVNGHSAWPSLEGRGMRDLWCRTKS
jgi:hypothetical protein